MNKPKVQAKKSSNRVAEQTSPVDLVCHECKKPAGADTWWTWGEDGHTPEPWCMLCVTRHTRRDGTPRRIGNIVRALSERYAGKTGSLAPEHAAKIKALEAKLSAQDYMDVEDVTRWEQKLGIDPQGQRVA